MKTNNIGARLRNRIEAEDLSVPKFAKKYNLNKENVYKWRNGTIPSNPEEYNKLQKILEIVPESESTSSIYQNERGNNLTTEANLTSIETGIKLDYLIAMVAEIQEYQIPQKEASDIVSKLQKRIESDFENALEKLRS